MKKYIYMTIILTYACLASSKEKTIYKYKQYEKFDLGDLEIKGSIIAPGDLSIKERRRKIFKRRLFMRRDFDDLVISDIKYIR